MCIESNNSSNQEQYLQQFEEFKEIKYNLDVNIVKKTVEYAIYIMEGSFPSNFKLNTIFCFEDIYLHLKRFHFYQECLIKTLDQRLKKDFTILDDFLKKYTCELIDLESLRKLTPRGFEKFCAAIIEKLGYLVEMITKQTHDSGFDISVYKDRKNVLCECKRYREENKVGVDKVRNFADSCMRKKAKKGIFITTTAFTKNVVKEQKERKIDIEFWDGVTFLEIIKSKKIKFIIFPSADFFLILSDQLYYFNKKDKKTFLRALGISDKTIKLPWKRTSKILKNKFSLTMKHKYIFKKRLISCVYFFLRTSNFRKS